MGADASFSRAHLFAQAAKGNQTHADQKQDGAYDCNKQRAPLADQALNGAGEQRAEQAAAGVLLPRHGEEIDVAGNTHPAGDAFAGKRLHGAQQAQLKQEDEQEHLRKLVLLSVRAIGKHARPCKHDGERPTHGADKAGNGLFKDIEAGVFIRPDAGDEQRQRRKTEHQYKREIAPGIHLLRLLAARSRLSAPRRGLCGSSHIPSAYQYFHRIYYTSSTPKMQPFAKAARVESGWVTCAHTREKGCQPRAKTARTRTCGGTGAYG